MLGFLSILKTSSWRGKVRSSIFISLLSSFNCFSEGSSGMSLTRREHDQLEQSHKPVKGLDIVVAEIK